MFSFCLPAPFLFASLAFAVLAWPGGHIDLDDLKFLAVRLHFSFHFHMTS